MSWIGGGLSNLKDQLTSLTKEVLDAHSEDTTEVDVNEDVADKDKLIKDLKEKCQAKDDEIIELKKLVENINRKSSGSQNFGAGNTSSQVAKLVCTPVDNVSSFREDGLSEIFLGQETEPESELEREYEKKEIESLKAKLHAITIDYENLTRTCDKLKEELKSYKKKKLPRLTNTCMQTDEDLQDILNLELTRANEVLKTENNELTKKLLDTMDGMTDMQLRFQKDLQEIKTNNDEVIHRLTAQKNEIADNFGKLEAEYRTLKKGLKETDESTFSVEVACQIPEPDNGSSIAESEMSYDSLSDFALLSIKMNEKGQGESVENDNQQQLQLQQNKRISDLKGDREFYQHMYAKNHEILSKYESLDQELVKLLGSEKYKALKNTIRPESMENQDNEIASDKTESEIARVEIEDMIKECNDLKREVELLQANLEEERAIAKSILEQLQSLQEKDEKLENELTLERKKCETFQRCIKNLRETLIQFQQQASLSLDTTEPGKDRDGESEQRRIECLGEQSAPGFYNEDSEILNWLERVTLRLTKSLEDEMERNNILYEERNKLMNETKRLRDHLINIEKMQTTELVQFQEKVQELEQDLGSTKRDLKRANANGTTLEHVVRQLTAERNQLAGKIDIIRQDFSRCTTTLQKQTSELLNLQNVIDDFQKNKETDIQLAMENVREKFDELQEYCEAQRNEISRLKAALSKANEELKDLESIQDHAMDQLRTISVLESQLKRMTNTAQKIERSMQEMEKSMEGKIDKSLVANLLVGYVNAPASSKSQALQVLASILNMELTDKLKRSVEKPNTEIPASLTGAFIEFLERESRLQSPGTSGRGSRFENMDESRKQQRITSLINAMLPNLPQFPVGENSGFILKDVMKKEDEVE